MKRIALVSRSSVFRRSLRESIDSAQVEIVASSGSLEAAVARLTLTGTDCVLIAFDRPAAEIYGFLNSIKKLCPVILVLLAKHQSKEVEALQDAGAIPCMVEGRAASSNLEGAIEALQSHLGALPVSKRARTPRGTRQPPVARGNSTHSRLSSSGATQGVETVQGPVLRKLLCIGASTGGPAAIESLLSGLAPSDAGIVIVQHMPGRFTQSFAERLNKLTRWTVLHAEEAMPVPLGTAIIAPGGRHLEIYRIRHGDYAVRLLDTPPVLRHRPSVDVMMASAAVAAGTDSVGVILTGMQNDGAQGLLAMRKQGAYTLTQDEESSVVYSMPKAAVLLGASSEVASLAEMPKAIAAALRKRRLPRYR